MLVSMTIQNIALIEQLTIHFHKGLHVLSGETGAGKSIVVDSINLVLGERADRGLIRSGCEKASVEALIDISDSPQVKALLDAESLECDGNLMSILREISISDRNICRICGVVMPLSFLRQISSLLVDIHGQHEHQSLLAVTNHLQFLDSFGDEEYQALIADAEQKYHIWKKSSSHFATLRKDNAMREEKQALASQRYQELAAAKLQPGEEAALELEKAQFAGAERIAQSVGTAYRALYDGDPKAAYLQLNTAQEAMSRIADLSPDYQSLAQRISSLYYEVEEIGLELRGISDAKAFDPDRYEEIQERLDLFRRLERRYGKTIDELIDYRDDLKIELNQLQSMDELLARAEDDYKRKLMDYRTAAALLTKARMALSKRFETLMEKQLSDLGMEKTHFEVVFQKPEEGKKTIPSERGDDHIEFFIAPNPGEPLKPLSKTASGGELSRLMLAMKAAAADRNLIPCMIFDEIDTGISGHVAGVVAEKMANIAKYRQVICVTHLAQIAAMADTEYKVEKRVIGERTNTFVKELDGDDRVAEIARLVGAESSHIDSALIHARNMLSSANDYKRSL